jgi:cytidyltransferase-like protein
MSKSLNYKFPQILQKSIKIKVVSAQFGAKKLNFMKPKAIIVSGYFNPIHKGHIEYFNNAKANGDKLIVIVNNDHQRALKGSKEFQKEDERVFIVSNIKSVDQVFLSVDQDRTVCATIKLIHKQLSNDYKLAFANGGDQNNDSIPEVPICTELGIELIDGLGDKIQSSSWLLNK